jgi:hypothetical protein
MKIQTNETGSRISLAELGLKYLADLQDGEKAEGNIFFTDTGFAFVWPQSTVGGSDIVWHDKGKWYGTLRDEGVEHRQFTGYSTVAGADGVPVTIVEG